MVVFNNFKASLPQDFVSKYEKDEIEQTTMQPQEKVQKKLKLNVNSV